MSISIEMTHLVKRYGNQTVIPDLSLTVNSGELFTLLGPSGCGKTTLLRMIAGFNTVEGGSICFGKQDITHVPAHQRNIGMVFQNYAIFPNLSVRRNIEYGFRSRRVPRDEMRRRVEEIMEAVQITPLQDRMPDQLSGGQLQRVALARAIVIHPSVLLMDEPLSNLDAKLRIELREAIRDIQQEIGITTVYVTHDQEEALAISDRIGVMNGGVLQQVGTPFEIYSRPANGFVATFIGRSGLLRAQVSGGQLVFPDGSRCEAPASSAAEGQRVVLAVRPEEFAEGGTGIPARVKRATFLGRSIQYILEFAPGVAVDGYPPVEYIEPFTGRKPAHAAGDTVLLRPDTARVNLFTEDLSASLMGGAAR